MNNFLQYILHGKRLPTENSINLQNFGQNLNEEFEKSHQFSLAPQPREIPGKLGGKTVVLDASTNVGIFMVEEDRLGVSSQANFSTVRANCCVYKGKWVYEVMLNTKGVMQLGWSTKNCQFTQEQGVGDTPDSFAYDGNRIRKWNVSTAKYGEGWRIGDTISCAIDMDVGTINFYRNGKNLGEAFNNIKLGYGMAYFPTISLSIHESVRLNFGATPLLHRLEGYSPIQDPPVQDLVKAKILFAGLQRVLDIFVRLDAAYSQTKPNLPLSMNAGASKDTDDSDTSSTISNITKPEYITIPRFSVEKMDTTTPTSPINLTSFTNNKKAKTSEKSSFDYRMDRSTRRSTVFDENTPEFDITSLPNYHRQFKLNNSGEISETSENINGTYDEPPFISPQALLYIVSGYYFDKFAKVLGNNAYVTEACLFKFLNRHTIVNFGLYAPSSLDNYQNTKISDSTKAFDNLIDTVNINNDSNIDELNEEIRYNYSIIHKFLDILWAFMDEVAIKHVMENLMTSILVHYRFSPLEADFRNQKLYLSYMKCLLAHEPTRKYLLQNVLFEKVKLPLLMHLKSPDYTLLETFVPRPYVNTGHIFNQNLLSKGSNNDLNGYSNTSIPQSVDKDKNVMSDPNIKDEKIGTSLYLFTSEKTKNAYDTSINNMRHLVSDIEVMQQDILQMLLNNRDTLRGFSSRYLFLKKFRDFLRQNLNINIVHHPFNKCPLPAILCLFQHLAKQLRLEWDRYNQKYPHRSVPSSSAFIPLSYFYNDTINYFEIQRLAGLLSYLKKTYETELNQALSGDSPIPLIEASKPMELGALSAQTPSKSNVFTSLNTNTTNGTSTLNIAVSNQQPSSSDSSFSAFTAFSVNPRHKSEASSSSLIELLDGTVMLYHIAGHKHTSKMAKVRDVLKEYLNTIKNLQYKIDRCPTQHPEVKASLEKTKDIFVSNALEQARLLAWIRIMVFSKEKQDNVAWILGVIISTLNRAIQKGGNLHLFIPEFYLETCLNAFADLKINFHPTAPLSDIKDFNFLLTSYVLLIVRIFSHDASKIVNSELRDRLTQSLADLVCYPASLKVLENELNAEQRLGLVETLLKPYENRPWAQTNWILVRFWKGSGFGFRYITLPKCSNAPVSLTGQSNHSMDSANSNINDSFGSNVRSSGGSTMTLPTNIMEPSFRPGTSNDARGLSALATAETPSALSPNTMGLTTIATQQQPPFMNTPPQNDDLVMSSKYVEYLKPMPSIIYQHHVGQVLERDPEKASTTVNSMLNQLNWAFSEFVGMLQEIQQAASRLDVQVYIDARQLKLCATCFDLTVALLRTLEMIATNCPSVFTAFSDRPAAEIMLTNLFQLTCQILARVTTLKSAFNLVVNLGMPGLDMVQHYPILAAVAGILVQLILRVDEGSRSRTLYTLLHEPGFQLSALQTLVGIEKVVPPTNTSATTLGPTVANDPSANVETATPVTTSTTIDHPLSQQVSQRLLQQTKAQIGSEGSIASTAAQDLRIKRQLNLKNYNELDEHEFKDLDLLIDLLELEQGRISSARVSVSEDDMCPICYARPLEVQFYPCGHKSCRSCITHYLMNKRECFFCKSNVGMVEDLKKSPSAAQ